MARGVPGQVVEVVRFLPTLQAEGLLGAALGDGPSHVAIEARRFARQKAAFLVVSLLATAEVALVGVLRKRTVDLLNRCDFAFRHHTKLGTAREKCARKNGMGWLERIQQNKPNTTLSLRKLDGMAVLSWWSDLSG